MDRGSLSIVFRCPKCSNEVAMRTNPYETQGVGSLGVKLGDTAAAAGDGDGSQASKCPFTDVVRSLGGESSASAPGTASSFGLMSFALMKLMRRTYRCTQTMNVRKTVAKTGPKMVKLIELMLPEI